MKHGLLVLAFCIVASAAVAQTDRPDFAELDTDGNGALTEAEAAASEVITDFKTGDLNRDGVIDRAEYERVASGAKG